MGKMENKDSLIDMGIKREVSINVDKVDSPPAGQVPLDTLGRDP